MNKYIIPLILTYILTIFITSTITIKIMEDKENQELNICKGMNNTYLEEIYARDEIIEDLKENE